MHDRIEGLIRTYEESIKGAETRASVASDRATGGVLRAEKGKLQEYITEEIVKIAWDNLKGGSDHSSRLDINSRKLKISIREDYINAIGDVQIREYLLQHKDDYSYGISVDKHVFVDGKFVIGIECKSYAENAMLKRILVDFSLLRSIHPDITCYLFQLESQLGGDYSELKKVTLGSKSSHTLMSYFPDVTLNIVTLLPGERKIDQPIHAEGHFKPLQYEQLKRAVLVLQKDLARHITLFG